ncbi:MAG: hypothetical protein ABII23_00755, partial [bacterium]
YVDVQVAPSHQSIDEAIDNIISDCGKSNITYAEVIYWPIVIPIISIGWRSYLKWMVDRALVLSDIFKLCRQYVIVSFLGLDLMGIIAELSRKMGKRSLFISHGTHPIPVNDCHEKELTNLCKHFMHGDYTDIALSLPVQETHLHYFKKKYTYVKNNEIKTDPVLFAQVNKSDKESLKRKYGLQPDDFVFLHATSNTERFLFIETFDEFFSSVRNIIMTIDSIAHMRLILRLHPGFGLTDDEVRYLLPESDNYIISSSGPFADVLSAADALVSYSSTTIDEALLNRIPVLLYDKWNRYNHFNTPIFENKDSKGIYPVCYVNNEFKLHDAMQFIRDERNIFAQHDERYNQYRYHENYKKNLFSFIENALQL